MTQITSPHFAGPVYVPRYDQERLSAQLKRIVAVMADEQWHTLDEISLATGDPHASISAQLRHLRKPRFGGHSVEKRPRGDRSRGLWEYRVLFTAERKEDKYDET